MEEIEIVGEEIKGTVKTPAWHNLFHVNNSFIKLVGKNHETFYYLTKKSLYIKKRDRPDLETVVDFLTTLKKSRKGSYLDSEHN